MNFTATGLLVLAGVAACTSTVKQSGKDGDAATVDAGGAAGAGGSAGAAGAGGAAGATTCTPTAAPNNACTPCLTTHCPAIYATCACDAGCAPLLICAEKCIASGSGTSACALNCYSKASQATRALFDALTACAKTPCETECSAITALSSK